MDKAFVFVKVLVIFLIVLSFALPCTAAEDAQWKMFDSCVDLADYYYDTKSVTADR